MKADTVSSFVGREIQRSSMARNQRSLVDALKEFSTLRHADVGKALGGRVGGVLDMRSILGTLSGLTNTNSVVKQRMDHVQSSFAAMRDLGADFSEATLGVHKTGADRGLLISDAKARMGTLTDVLRTSTNGVYAFSGLNVSAPPVENYLSDPQSAARAAVIAAFEAEFGFPPDDPQVVTITPAEMEAYIDGPFSALFEEPQWSANFSQATDAVMRDRISQHEEIDTSATVNDAGVRQLFFSLTLAIDGGAEGLRTDTFEVLATRIANTASEAGHNVAATQARVGVVQERLAQANERIALETKTLELRVGELEGVDSFAAADRLSQLEARIEASYAITARMQQLTLLNYL
jgi:flagellar hook-associated protein 3 FlgL